MDVSDAAASIYSGVGGVSERDHRYAHCHPRARSFHAEFGGEKCFGRQQRIAFTRSATRRISPRERNSLLASETFFPTKFGMETSRPWMAMRIAVIALRNAADARINTSSSIRNIHSSRSRKFIGGISPLIYSSFRAKRGISLGFVAALAILFLHQRRRRIIRQLILAG